MLAACAARELDLHSAVFGVSILKARFYSRYGTPPEILGAILLLLPILISLVFLARKQGKAWWRGVRAYRPHSITILTFFFAMVVSKTADRLLGILRDLGLLSPWMVELRFVLLSVEECLELLIPMLAVMAIWQARSARPKPVISVSGASRAP